MDNLVPDGGVDLTIKHCMPFIDALITGFMIPLQADIQVKDGEFSEDWPHEESPLGLHFATQAPGVPFVDEGEVVIKAHNFWSIHTETGYANFFTHPLNRLDLPFRTLSSVVDTDSFDALPVHFPMVWVDRYFEGTLPAGTPIAQRMPIERGRVDMQIETMGSDEYVEAKAHKNRIRDERGFYKDHLRQDSS